MGKALLGVVDVATTLCSLRLYVGLVR